MFASDAVSRVFAGNFHAVRSHRSEQLPRSLWLGKQDFVYLPEEDAHRCPADEKPPYRFASEEDGKRMRRY
jgi:hypothetical protein